MSSCMKPQRWVAGPKTGAGGRRLPYIPTYTAVRASAYVTTLGREPMVAVHDKVSSG